MKFLENCPGTDGVYPTSITGGGPDQGIDAIWTEVCPGATISARGYEGNGTLDWWTTTYASSGSPPVMPSSTGGTPPGTLDSPEPVDTYTGDYLYSHTDVAEQGNGPVPLFTRSYNSLDQRGTDLGTGWTDNYGARLNADPSATSNLIVVNPDGRSDEYTYSSGSYAPPPGISAQLVAATNSTYGSSYTLTQPDQTQWFFDSYGKLVAIQDRYGNASVLTYNSSDQITAVSDPAGRGSMTFTYGSGLPSASNTCPAHRVCTVTDMAGHPVTYTYDTYARLTTVTDRTAAVTTYGYTIGSNGQSQLTTITDANGAVDHYTDMTLAYDSNGRVHTQTDALGNVTTYSYTLNGSGQVTQAQYTLPTASYEGATPTVTDNYDSNGHVSSRETVASSDSADNVTQSYSFDASTGFLDSYTDGRGKQTSYCYDTGYNGSSISGSRGNLTRVIAPPPSGSTPLVELLKYDSKNNLLETVAPKGVSNPSSVLCSTDLSSDVNSSGLWVTDSTFDTTLGTELISLTQKYTDPDNGVQTATTTYGYNDSSNPLKGLVASIESPRSNTTSLGYYPRSDAEHRGGLLESAADPLSDTTTFDYDLNGSVTTVVDPLGNAGGGAPSQHEWTWTYDNEERAETTSAPPPQAGGSALQTQATYDAVGNVTSVEDANGAITRYVYNARDGLQEVDQSATQSDPTTDANKIRTLYSYDALGNLERVDRDSGGSAERVTDYCSDGLNRPRIEVQYPSGSWPSSPNDCAASGALVSSRTYDKDSNPVTTTDPLGQTTTYGYDADNRLTGLTYGTPASGVASASNVTYAYDANGNRMSMVDGTGTTSYVYDELNRLTSVTRPGTNPVGYRYDLDGNERKLIYPGGSAVTYSTDNADRLTGLSDWASQSSSYTYYPDSLLQMVTNPNGTTATYTYDNARRLSQVLNQVGTSGTQIISRHSYTRDAVGNPTLLDQQLPELGTPGPAGLVVPDGAPDPGAGGAFPAGGLQALDPDVQQAASFGQPVALGPLAQAFPTPLPPSAYPSIVVPPPPAPYQPRGDGAGSATPTPTASTPGATATGTVTAAPTPTFSGIGTPVPTSSATATGSPGLSLTLTPGTTSTPTVTATTTVTATASVTATPCGPSLTPMPTATLALGTATLPATPTATLTGTAPGAACAPTTSPIPTGTLGGWVTGRSAYNILGFGLGWTHNI